MYASYVIISNYNIVARYLNAFMDRVGISAAPGPNTEGIFEPTASALQGQRSTADLSAQFSSDADEVYVIRKVM